MAIEIQGQHGTNVTGVNASTIEGSSFGWDHVGWAEQIIHVQRGANVTTYVAGQIIANILSDQVTWLPYPSVKFGPGGRRIYVQVTEQLIDDILKMYTNDDDKGGRWYRNDRERNRGHEIVDFATALIDFIS